MHLQMAVRRAPGEFAIHFELGRLHAGMGDPVEATRAFELAVAVAPGRANMVKAALARLQAGLSPDETAF